MSGYGLGLYGDGAYGLGNPTVPNAAAVLAYCVGNGQVSATLEKVQDALNAEIVDQANRCRTTPYTWPLAEALCRRVARNLAMRPLALGIVMDESGGTAIGSTDPEVRRLERPYRKVSLG